MTLTIDLVPHLDAGDRTQWPGDQDKRPLSELGRRQAAALDAALLRAPIDALYSSPALRCRQTIAPIAERLRLEINVLPDLRESDNFAGPEGWSGNPYGGAFAAGRAYAALDTVRRECASGHAVACSHGDAVPALVALLIGRYGLSGVPQLERRGQWYRLRFDEERLAIDLIEAPAFPL